MLRYGADTEDVQRLVSGMPNLPLAIAATYHRLDCFAALLLYGAQPGLPNIGELDLPPHIIAHLFVAHAIIKYR